MFTVLRMCSDKTVDRTADAKRNGDAWEKAGGGSPGSLTSELRDKQDKTS